jgi:hypothetical protein
LEAYSAHIETLVGQQLRGARLFAWLVHTFPRWATWAAAHNPSISRAFTRFFQGQVNYRELLFRMPLYLLTAGMIRRKTP